MEYQDWNEMECRLAYTNAELLEAQASPSNHSSLAQHPTLNPCTLTSHSSTPNFIPYNITPCGYTGLCYAQATGYMG